MRVAIIGAGASGLQCAANLLDSNVSVLVLEARNRVGGRIFTSTETRTKSTKDTAASKTTVSFSRDHGASWVHGIGCEADEWNPMVSLLKEVTPPGKCAVSTHLSQVTIGNPWTRPDTVLHKTGNISIYSNGALIPDESPLVSQAIQRHYELQNQVSDYASHLFETGKGMETVHLSVGEVRSKMLEKSNRKGLIGCATLAEDSEKVEKLFPFFNFLVENWNGISSIDMQVGSVATDPSDESMQTDELYTPDGDFRGPHCKVKNGMITVLQPLASKVECHVRLNEQALKIKDMNDHVRIETASGLILEAECCVCTIPLGCLKNSAGTLFEPALGDEKLEAIRSISAGTYKKVFLTFNIIFWPVEKPLIGLIREKSDELGKYLLVNNLWAKDGIPCLEAILCGDLGTWAINRSDEAIKNSVIEFLEDAMGLSSLQEHCTDCHVTRWEEDPFTLGSYSSFHLGTLERHIESFSLPEWGGRLVFAGEHTESEHQGSVHGALMSGNKAAEVVQEFLSSDTK